MHERRAVVILENLQHGGAAFGHAGSNGRIVEDLADGFASGPSAQIGGIIGDRKAASDFLKAVAHEGRLMILCHLLDGEKAVGALEALLGARQAAVSQQLARLRQEGLVACRRDGKTIHYSIDDPKVRLLIETMGALFRKPPQG